MWRFAFQTEAVISWLMNALEAAVVRWSGGDFWVDERFGGDGGSLWSGGLGLDGSWVVILLVCGRGSGRGSWFGWIVVRVDRSWFEWFGLFAVRVAVSGSVCG